jgi:hypothetical protein
MTGALSMQTDERNTPEKLKCDFVSYMNGEEPALLELERAPALENWHTIFVRTAIAPHVMLLVGMVTGHPQHPAGTKIHTSQLVWLDRNKRWARSWNRVYRLGAHSGGEADIGEQR